MNEATEAPVSPLELFFDLVFVFAITQIAALIRHDLSISSLGKGLLLLAMIYWAWSMFTWTLNATGTSRLGIRIALLAAMATSLLMARVIPDAFGSGGAYFAVAYFAFRVVANLAPFFTETRAERQAYWRFVPLATVAGLIALGGGFVADPLRSWIWLLSLGVDIVAAQAAGRTDFRINAGHFSERYGLLVIIALGELIVAIGVGISGVEVSVSLGVTVMVAFFATALLWWSYFDWVAGRVEDHLRGLTGTQRGAFARDAYTILHYPLVAGIVMFAVVVEEIVQHPSDQLAGLARGLLAAGFVLVLLAFVASAYRALRRVPYARLSAAAGVAIVSLLGGGLSGLAMLSIDSVLILLMLGYEGWVHRRSEGVAPGLP